MKGVLWLAWRQQRLMIGVATVFLLAVTAWAAYQRSEMMTQIDDYGFVPCKGWNGGCESLGTFVVLNGSTDSIRALGTLGLALPTLIGAFWGAPLLGREMETGTFKLALTQGVSGRRWFAARFGLAAVFAVIASSRSPRSSPGGGRPSPTPWTASTGTTPTSTTRPDPPPWPWPCSASPSARPSACWSAAPCPPWR